ncbi:hypothetical protein [Shimia ponticola]|uniref:hypothetical protein n=1 Tax=Shimia ponticola TaxID=2582893 RepID=UPI0011BFDFF4|nr:hypothetical protein [Shimia ponticola]
MPDTSNRTAKADQSYVAQRPLPDVLKRKSERPRFDPRVLPRGKGDPAGKQRGGRPPRFPGRTGGR